MLNCRNVLCNFPCISHRLVSVSFRAHPVKFCLSIPANLRTSQVCGSSHIMQHIHPIFPTFSFFFQTTVASMWEFPAVFRRAYKPVVSLGNGLEVIRPEQTL